MHFESARDFRHPVQSACFALPAKAAGFPQQVQELAKRAAVFQRHRRAAFRRDVRVACADIQIGREHHRRLHLQLLQGALQAAVERHRRHAHFHRLVQPRRSTMRYALARQIRSVVDDHQRPCWGRRRGWFRDEIASRLLRLSDLRLQRSEGAGG